MNVSPVLSTAGVVATGTASKAKTNQSAENAAPVTDSYSSTLSEIAAKYDPRHIALDDIPKLAKELHDNGLISGRNASLMSTLPQLERWLEEEGLTLGLQAGADGTVDLLRHFKDKLPYQRTEEATQRAEQAVDVLEALSGYSQSASKSGNVSTNTGGALNVSGAISAYTAGIKTTTFDTQKVLDVLQALVAKKESLPA